MNKESFYKKHSYILWTAFFLLIQILVIYRNINDSFIQFVWFCDFIPLLITIGFLTKNNSLIKGIINVTLIVQLAFLTGMILGTYIYPHTNFTYLFEAYGTMNYLGKGIPYTFITILTHLTSPIALFILIKKENNKKSLYYSIALILSTLIITNLFTKPTDNLNYVYSFGKGILAQTTWTLILFLVITLPTYKLQQLLQKINTKESFTSLKRQKKEQ